MKHLILFLNYSRSRLDNPVFQRFSENAGRLRNTRLVFLAKPLEERELMHQVNDLRRKEVTPSDVTFHVCYNLATAGASEVAVSTLRLIRRHFTPAEACSYPIFVYGLLTAPAKLDAKACREELANLMLLNNAAADYHHHTFISNCFLSTDLSQLQLTEFLFNVTRSNLTLPVSRFTTTSGEVEWLPIYAGFNVACITYPEDSVRFYLNQVYVNAVLRYGMPEFNPTPMEVCNREAAQILTFVPIQNDRISLQAEEFIHLADDSSTWSSIRSYWEQGLDMSLQGLKDLPREDWLLKVRQRLDSLYQGRFRDVGVDFFFQLENKKVPDYARVIVEIIAQQLSRTMHDNPFAPEVRKSIIHAIVNMLQQKVIELQQLRESVHNDVLQAERDLRIIAEDWGSLNIFSRMMGKDTTVFSRFKERICQLYCLRSSEPGYAFAVRLLNEVIPSISSNLGADDSTLQHCINDAVALTARSIDESDPRPNLGTFPADDLDEAVTFIRADHEHLIGSYSQLAHVFYDEGAPASAEELVARVKSILREQAESYLNAQITSSRIPPVLNLSIVERIDRLYRSQGGLVGCIEELRQKVGIDLPLKTKESGDATPLATSPVSDAGITPDFKEKYLLIAPDSDSAPSEQLRSGIPGIQWCKSDDFSSLQLLHFVTDVTLADMDGFGGQRMFVEPSIF